MEQGNAVCADETTVEFGPTHELERIKATLSQRLLSHPFLACCRDGTVTMRALRAFLVQHGKYSSYFTRYLCALMSNLDRGDDVLRLAENLAEELGAGDESSIPHSRLYAEMLDGFGVCPDREEAYPETRSLIDTMFMLCRQPGGIAGLGALGFGAEAIVPATYSRVLAGFKSHGITGEQVKFFSLHVDCDDAHADTMFQILEREMARSPSARVAAVSAAEIAVNARLRFFDALVREAA